MAAAPEITPFALPPTAVQLVERQQVTTISVVASSAPSGMSNPDPEPEKKGFPVAVAIPALVGGMAAAFAAFGLWWWCNKRSKRERRERWEAAQRRKQRQRANSAGRPSMSTSRNPSATNLKSMAGGGEKDVVPPVPALPKHYPATEKQHGYGYGGHPQQQQQQQYDQYAQHQQYGYVQDQHHNQYHQQQQQQQQYQYHTQPTIDENPTSPTYSDHSNSNSSSAGSQSSSTPLTKESKKTSPTKSGSRSTARVAVADSAAATAGLDANVRYQPKKPSPLALKAMEKQNARNEWAEGPFRTASAGHEEMLAEQEQYAATGGAQASGRNVMSGEWGVALGSPNHDTSASFAEQQASATGNNRYSNDPYLSANAGGNRAPSGHYSNDPYAGYHDPVVNSTGKRSNWV